MEKPRPEDKIKEQSEQQWQSYIFQEPSTNMYSIDHLQ
jgi:hypothetical protein